MSEFRLTPFVPPPPQPTGADRLFARSRSLMSRGYTRDFAFDHAIRLGRAGLIVRAWTGYNETTKRNLKESWAPLWAVVLARAGWVSKRLRKLHTKLGPHHERLALDSELVEAIRRGYDQREIVAMLTGERNPEVETGW